MSEDKWDELIFKLMIIQEYGKTEIYKQRAMILINAIEIYLKNKK